jgi:hypothetical protein
MSQTLFVFIFVSSFGLAQLTVENSSFSPPPPFFSLLYVSISSIDALPFFSFYTLYSIERMYNDFVLLLLSFCATLRSVIT